MIHDPALLKLGRPNLPVHDPRTLRFAKYVKPGLPVPPKNFDWGTKVKTWDMLDNDKLGICTIAGLLHINMLWKSQFGEVPNYRGMARPLYSKYCGYVEGDPSTDNGAVEIDILKAWRKEPIAGVQLLAFAAVDPTDWEMVRLALWECGALYMGVNLNKSAQTEKIWSSTHDKPGSWDPSGNAGHCMVAVATSEKGGFGCSRYLDAVTWGMRQKMTPGWLEKYCDELWAPIPVAPIWTGVNDNAPNSLNRAQILADVAAAARMAA